MSCIGDISPNKAEGVVHYSQQTIGSNDIRYTLYVTACSFCGVFLLKLLNVLS